MAQRLTPVMKQHAEAKRAHPDAIVFFRMGDFYEMFGEDAVIGSRELDLTLTSRNKGKPDEIPMAGVPHHSAHGYIGRLLEKGHKVAICEQMADPSTVKGLVPRQVVRVVTAATVLENDQLEARQNCWLAAAEWSEGAAGIALFDLSTSDLSAASLSDASVLLSELARAAPREILLEETAVTPDSGHAPLAEALGKVCPDAALRFDLPLASEDSDKLLGKLAGDARSLGIEAARAAARALRYAARCNPGKDVSVRRIGHYSPSQHMNVDPVAQEHLELVRSPAGKQATLLAVIDHTVTPGGARLLRQRLLAPLLSVEGIRRRLDEVELFLVHSRLRAELRDVLQGVGDLERLATRISLDEGTPRDLGALRDGLSRAGEAVERLLSDADGAMLEVLGLDRAPDRVADVADELSRALLDVPGRQLKPGALFRPAYDRELAELSESKAKGTERIVEYEGRLRQETQIQQLKVRFTRVFGWYIEVSRSHAERVPPAWKRKQTVASGERFITEELDDLALTIENADAQREARESELLKQLLDQVKQAAERVRELSRTIARLDVALALAEVAHRFDYCRPSVDDGDVLEIQDGRHPVVERLAAAGRFVPNDVRLVADDVCLWLVTGPNMAGKSTLLRQVALTAILAQLGSYVPARQATVGVVDRVLSRVGASDNLSGGESTFMVEMRETSSILRSATRRSLVILDEIGRGTSTFDGLAIAWAVAEFLADAVGCRALFATHYYELTKLSDESRRVTNYSVSARELDDRIVFLHRLVQGAANQSYGVAVAKLAGLPETVLARARQLLARLEQGQGPRSKLAGESADEQLDRFRQTGDGQTRAALEHLRALDLERLTGIEALNVLSRLKSRIE